MQPKLLTLTRDRSTMMGTPGLLCIPEVPFQYLTLELPWRDNQPTISCIPTGRYRFVFCWSNALKRNTWRVVDVVGRAGILMHAGNAAGALDAEYQSDSIGCILIGLELTMQRGNTGRRQYWLKDSQRALHEVEQLLSGEEWEILVRDATPASHTMEVSNA